MKVIKIFGMLYIKKECMQPELTLQNPSEYRVCMRVCVYMWAQACRDSHQNVQLSSWSGRARWRMPLSHMLF